MLTVAVLTAITCSKLPTLLPLLSTLLSSWLTAVSASEMGFTLALLVRLLFESYASYTITMHCTE
jgi:hypothetical protein